MATKTNDDGADSPKVAGPRAGTAIRGRLAVSPVACVVDLAASELDLAARFRSAPRSLRAVFAQCVHSRKGDFEDTKTKGTDYGTERRVGTGAV